MAKKPTPFEKEKQKRIRAYSVWGSTEEENKWFEDNDVSFFKCACCGCKYPEGRESNDDLAVCDNCG